MRRGCLGVIVLDRDRATAAPRRAARAGHRLLNELRGK
jgi:hypothetical protein